MNNVEDVKVLEAVENVGNKFSWQTGAILAGAAFVGGIIDRFVVPPIVNRVKNLATKFKTSKESEEVKENK